MKFQYEQEKYAEFCLKCEYVPLYLKPFWLDAVKDSGDWTAVFVKENNKYIAAMPLFFEDCTKQNCITQPKLTQCLGPIIINSHISSKKINGYNKKIYNKLIENIGKFDIFIQNFHYSFTDWCSFYWENFSQTTRYTYILDLCSSEDVLFQNLSSNIRTDIKKAINTYSIEIRDDLAVDDFLCVNKMTFSRQGLKQPYTDSFFKKFYKKIVDNKAGKLFFAVNGNAEVIASALICWDENSAYYIAGGGNPELRNSGATSLLLWEAIKFSKKFVNKFDFEGSMLQSVERFFRAFGATPVPYFQISKESYRFKYINALRTVLSPLKHPSKIIKLINNEN